MNKLNILTDEEWDIWVYNMMQEASKAALLELHRSTKRKYEAIAECRADAIVQLCLTGK